MKYKIIIQSIEFILLYLSNHIFVILQLKYHLNMLIKIANKYQNIFIKLMVNLNSKKIIIISDTHKSHKR